MNHAEYKERLEEIFESILTMGYKENEYPDKTDEPEKKILLQSITDLMVEVVGEKKDMDFSWLGGGKEDIAHTEGLQEGFNLAKDEILKTIRGE